MDGKQRQKFLRQLPEGLICIEDVAILLCSSVSNCRKYKDLGIIDPVRFDKHRHLYDLGEIKDVEQNLPKLKIDHVLSKTGPLFKQRRQNRRQKYPEGYSWPVVRDNGEKIVI